MVTGLGALSAYGRGREALLRGLLENRIPTRPVDRFPTDRFQGRVAALYPPEVSEFLDTQVGRANDLSRRAAVVAATDAVSEAALGSEDLWGMGVCAAAVGGRDAESSGQLSANADARADSHAGALAVHVMEAIRARGLTLTFANACAAGLTALTAARDLVTLGYVEVALVVAAVSVGIYDFARFDSLRALAPDACHPFSQGRAGLILGDAAVALVVESDDRAASRGVRPLAELAGCGLACDQNGTDTAPDPDGTGLADAIRHALREAGEAPSSVDWVHTHGTGTPLNDVAEVRAVRRALGVRAATIPVISTKAGTGHALEASGLLGVAVAVGSIEMGVVPPTLGYIPRDPECDLNHSPQEPLKRPSRCVLVLAHGFGGTAAAVLVRRWESGCSSGGR